MIKVNAESRLAARLKRVTATVLPVGARTRDDAAPVQEFKVMSGAVSAEYGRAGGGVVSYATRPGGGSVARYPDT